MGTSLSKFCPCLSRETVVIEDVKDFKEDNKQVAFDSFIHDELATSIIWYVRKNTHSYNI